MSAPQTPHIDPETGLDTSSFNAMIRGGKYHARDRYRIHLARRASDVLQRFNGERDEDLRAEILRRFFKNTSGEEKPRWIVCVPFSCEYGVNIRLGKDVYIAKGCTILDSCPVTIGSRTMIGPDVSIYTPIHPTSPEERNGLAGEQWAAPVVIGEDCWIGGSVVILPGVTVGKGSTVGAGSVVTKDIPERSMAVGNPARVIKTIPLPDEGSL